MNTDFQQDLRDLLFNIHPELIKACGGYRLILTDIRKDDCITPVYWLSAEGCSTLESKEDTFAQLHVEPEEYPDVFSPEVLDDMFAYWKQKVEKNGFPSEQEKEEYEAQKEKIEDVVESIHQIVDPAYFEMAVLQEDDDNGLYKSLLKSSKETFFSTAESLSTIQTLSALFKDGVGSKQLRDLFLHHEILRIMDLLYGHCEISEGSYFSRYWKEIGCSLLPEPDQSIDNLIEAFAYASLHVRFPELHDRIILKSEIAQFPYGRNYQLLAVSVLSGDNKEVDVLFDSDVDEDQNSSFVQHALTVLFQKWTDIFQYALQSSNSSYIMDVESVIRLTARDLTEGRKLPNYSLFVRLSGERYESNPCSGAMTFVDVTPHNGPDCLVAFRESIPFDVDHVRMIRKLLEMTSGPENEGYYLCVNIYKPQNPNIIGLVPAKKYKEARVLKFNGLLRWTLYEKSKEIISFSEGKYTYSSLSFQKEKETLCGFLDSGTEQAEKLQSLIESGWLQSHGTLIIIFPNKEDAAEEAARLLEMRRGIQPGSPIPCYNNGKLIAALTSIDGALLVDADMMIHGIGVILDGEAKVPGLPSRGARFNSAKNYVNWLFAKYRRKAAALIVSEDRTLDVILPCEKCAGEL